MAFDSRSGRSPSNYRPIGTVTRDTAVTAEMGPSSSDWHFRAEDGTRAEVAVLREDLTRVRLLPAGLEPARSWAVVGGEGPVVATSVSEDSSGVISLSTSMMRVVISTHPFRVAFTWLDDVSFAVDDGALGMGYGAA